MAKKLPVNREKKLRRGPASPSSRWRPATQSQTTYVTLISLLPNLVSLRSLGVRATRRRRHRGHPVIVSVTAIGQAPAEQVVLRSTAQPGDTIMVGRTVGDGAAGLALIRRDLPQSSDQSAPPNPGDPPNPTDLPNPAERALLRAHLEPVPQVELGRWLARNHLATAMIDLSDGVLADLGHICEASGRRAGSEPSSSPKSSPSPRRRKPSPKSWAPTPSTGRSTEEKTTVCSFASLPKTPLTSRPAANRS